MKLLDHRRRFPCDIVGTILVLVDVVLSRRNKAKLGALQEHITNLEVLTHTTKRMPPAQPGETVDGITVA